MAILAGIAFLSLLFVGVPPIAPLPIISLKARLTPLTQPLLLLALLPNALWTLGGFTIYTYINPFFQQTTHVTDPSALLLLYGIGSVIGNWVGDILLIDLELFVLLFAL